MAFDNIRLEKGMYRESGKNFTQVLESIDPSEAYKGTALEGTDAFQRQLKRFGIRVKGAASDPVEKFFATYESAVLFPEFISRVVRQGMEENDVLPSLVATVTNIDAMDYRSIYSAASEDECSLANIVEGSEIPATVIKSGEKLISLNKRGRMLVASYEALRFQKLDLFSVMLRQIGAQIRIQHLADAVHVLEMNSNNYSIGSTPIGGTSGTLSYEALVDFWAQFYPYEMNTMLVSSATLSAFLKLPEFQNPLTGINFQGTGKVSTPLGAQILRSDHVNDEFIYALDRRYALEMVQAGDVSVEHDKLIDRQLERTAITHISGFGIIMKNAAAILEF